MNRGEAWEKIELYKQGSWEFRAINTWSLDRLEDERVWLKFRGKIEGTEKEVSLDGSQQGRFGIERKTGMPLEGEIVQDMTAAITSGGVETEMGIEGTVSFVLKRTDG